MLSFHDIETLFAPITEEHFAPDKVSSTAEGYRHKTENGMGANDSNRSLEDIYQEMFSLEKEQMKRLKEDITRNSFSHGNLPRQVRKYLSDYKFSL